MTSPSEAMVALLNLGSIAIFKQAKFSLVAARVACRDRFHGALINRAAIGTFASSKSLIPTTPDPAGKSYSTTNKSGWPEFQQRAIYALTVGDEN